MGFSHSTREGRYARMRTEHLAGGRTDINPKPKTLNPNHRWKDGISEGCQTKYDGATYANLFFVFKVEVILSILGGVGAILDICRSCVFFFSLLLGRFTLLLGLYPSIRSLLPFYWVFFLSWCVFNKP